MAKLQEAQLHQIIISEKVWIEVENTVEEFQRDTWKRLVGTKQEDNFLELIRWLFPLVDICMDVDEQSQYSLGTWRGR